MGLRSFPVLYASDVATVAAFYELLGFKEAYRFPPGTPDPGYIGLRRDRCDLGVASDESPRWLAGVRPGPGPRHELFVYVEDLDRMMSGLRRVSNVLREPAVMPWGERLAYLTDPEGNIVALAEVGDKGSPPPAGGPDDLAA